MRYYGPHRTEADSLGEKMCIIHLCFHIDRVVNRVASVLHLSHLCTIVLLKSVSLSQLANCRSQFLIDRLGRCRPLTVRISVWPSNFFICEKHSKPRGNRAASASVYFNGQRPAIVTSGAGHHAWLAQTHRISIRRRRCVWVCTRSCGCMRPFVCACVRDVFAIYDDDILPRLIMIIIKNIILCFIQIRHTDHFPSTGTRLVHSNLFL